jgi:hypothetical protein
MLRMPTLIFVTRSIPHFPALSNINGSVVTQTLSPNKCGGDSVKRGSLVLKNSWRKGSHSSGIMSSMSVIGTLDTRHMGFKLTRHYN